MKPKTIIDVRTREEFAGGHVAGSVNIPLDEVPGRLADIRRLEQPIWLCCRTGNRSGVATAFLQQADIECSNGGSWYEVNALINGLIHA